MSLSRQDKTNYLQNIVLPNFNTLKTLPISSTLFDTESSILAITNQTLQQFGIESFNDLRPDILINPPADIVLKTTGMPIEYLDEVKKICNLLIKLQQITTQEKSIVSFSSFFPRHGEFRSRLTHLLPIVHPQGTVVAIQSISTEFRIFNVEEYLKYLPAYRHQPLTISEEIYKLPIKLTPRQHEILYFLIHDYSHTEIAAMLQVHRGTIARTITEAICIKFGINDSNTELLIKKARLMKYHCYLPPTLCRPCIIALVPQIIDKYFNGQSRLYPTK